MEPEDKPTQADRYNCGVIQMTVWSSWICQGCTTLTHTFIQRLKQFTLHPENRNWLGDAQVPLSTFMWDGLTTRKTEKPRMALPWFGSPDGFISFFLRASDGGVCPSVCPGGFPWRFPGGNLRSQSEGHISYLSAAGVQSWGYLSPRLTARAVHVCSCLFHFPT